MKKTLQNYSILLLSTTTGDDSKLHRLFKKIPIKSTFAPIAQLVEQCPFKAMVAGSNPAGCTIERILKFLF